MSDTHPIESIMKTTLENIKEMIDVNTIIGEAMQTPDGATIIPISKVCFGFVAGGGEYAEGPGKEKAGEKFPFAGGTGAGISLMPMALLVVKQGQVKVLPAAFATTIDRLIEIIPQIFDEWRKSGHASFEDE